MLVSVTACAVLLATRCSAARRTHAYCLQMELLEEVQAGSRGYAQKQIKWARGIELFRWLDATRPPAEIVAEIQQHLQDEPYIGM